MVLAAAILSLTPFVVIAWGVWEVRRTVAVARDRSLAVQELIGRIDYLDEGLSSTARLSAATGERRWEDRYVRLEDEVYAAIDSLDRVASAVGAPGIGDSILAVADSLASIEHAAFALARAGALAEARALLETPAYGEEKASYLRLREALLAELGAFTRDAEQETERRLLGILVFSASSLGILLFVWVFATRRVQRHMARRERAEAELRDRVVERRRLEEDLRKVESNLRAIVDVAPLAIVRVDNERRVQFWNPAAERIFGWSAEEVLGRPYPLEAPEDGGDVEALFDRGFGGENLEGVELRRLRKDGSEVHLRMWNASIREGGELRGWSASSPT